MKNVWALIGRMAFWLSWPLLALYLRRGRRTRVLIIHDAQVLVVKKWFGRGTWSLPGGGLRGREDPVSGAVREVAEETGLQFTASDLTSLGPAVGKEAGLRFDYEGFRVELASLPSIRPARFEILEVRWLPIADLSPANTDQTALDLLGRSLKS